MKILNPTLKDQIELLFSEYIDVLSELIVSSKIGSEDFRFNMIELFTECLCYRDELDEYLSNFQGKSVKCIMNCRGLDNYTQLYENLNSGCSRSVPFGLTLRTPQALVLSPSALEVIREGLRTFGSNDEGWSNLQRTFFPGTEPLALRQVFLASSSSRSDGQRWTWDEDFELVSQLERFGFSFRCIHETYLRLSETRSVDEIQTRLLTLRESPYRRKRPKVKKQDDFKVELDAPSPWSVDDTLLELNVK